MLTGLTYIYVGINILFYANIILVLFYAYCAKIHLGWNDCIILCLLGPHTSMLRKLYYSMLTGTTYIYVGITLLFYVDRAHIHLWWYNCVNLC